MEGFKQRKSVIFRLHSYNMWSQELGYWKKVGARSRSVFDWTEDQRILLGPLPNCSKLLVPDKFWAPSKIIIFRGAEISTVLLTWVRKNLSSSMFWWGILRKSSIPTTSNRSLPGLTKEDGDSIKFGPHPKVEFSMGLKAHTVRVSQKELYRA